MRYLPFYQDRNIPEAEVFDYLTSTMRSSIFGWDYYVNWVKVNRQAVLLSEQLTWLNGLIGVANLKSAFIALVKEHPSVVLSFPIMLAWRESSIEISEIENGVVVTEIFDFHPDAEALEPEHYWEIFVKSGLAQLFQDNNITNVHDYVRGIEVGLDSNGRKNRGGQAMEKLVEYFIDKECKAKGRRYLKEANSLKIKAAFGYDVPVDKSSRRYDFVIDLGNEPLIVETNFYGGGGSKLKSTAGEYKNLSDVLAGAFKFVWVTDGEGWKTTRHPLHEAFSHNDHIFNIHMLEQGILDKFIPATTISSSPVISPISLEMVQVPLVGTAPCGEPMFGETNIEGYISVEKSRLKPGVDYFVVRAEGDSMNQAGINEGDLVLCRHQQKGETGDRVVALLGGENVTIKVYGARDPEGIRKLLPKSSNKSHQPIIPAEGDIVQGVVQEVLE